MRTPAAAILALAFGHICCGDGASPVAVVLPTAPTVPITEAATTERWSLTTTYLGAAGGEACPSLGSPPVGTVRHLPLTIDRTGERRVVFTVSPANPNGQTWYAGTTDGDAFTATTGIGGGQMTCGGTQMAFTDEVRVTGRFFDDGRSLVAEDVYSTWLATGATLTWHTEWRATRQ
jgi:hypothetical protein